MRLTSLAKKRFRPLSHFSIPIPRKKAGWARRSILIFREFKKLFELRKILDIPHDLSWRRHATCQRRLETLLFDVVDVEPGVNDFFGWDELCDVAFKIHLKLDRHLIDSLAA